MADTPSSPSAASRSVAEFLRWWKQHLWDCVPAALRRRIVQSRRPALWSPSQDRVWAAGASFDSGQAFTQSALAQRGGEVTLVVGEGNGFRRTIELPISVEGRLQQVLGFELDRLTPLRPSELYYDFHVTERNNSAGTCQVELVAAPKTRVAPMLDGAAQKNIRVERLVLAVADADTTLDLLAPSRAQSGEAAAKRNWMTWALAALCLALLLAVVFFPLWQMRQHVIALQPIEGQAKADAEAASVLQRQVEKQTGDYNLPLSRKHASPLVIQVLEDMTKRLPDDTWLQSLEIHALPNQKTAREVVLQGETGSGGKIIQILQESALLKDPTLKSTMTRVAPTAERFHVAAELVAAQLPPPLVLADAAGVVTLAPSATAGAPGGAAPATAAAAAAAVAGSAAGAANAVLSAKPAAATPPTAPTAPPSVLTAPNGAAPATANGNGNGTPPPLADSRRPPPPNGTDGAAPSVADFRRARATTRGEPPVNGSEARP